VLLATGAVFAASLLSSLPPPPKALGTIGQPAAHVGPGPITSVIKRAGYQLEFHVNPNRVAVPNTFAVKITRDGKPVTGANVTATFTMLDMEMGQLAYHLKDVGEGLYQHAAPALVMVGRWGLSFDIEPRGSQPFSVLLLDTARG
jgi:copper transport protein